MLSLIIIGLESSVWMVAIATYLTDEKFLSSFFAVFENIPASILLVGILYIIGIIVDRCADFFTQKFEDAEKRRSKIASKSCAIIWSKSGREHFLQFVRTKIRILRASVFNMPIILFAAWMNLYKYGNKNCGLCIFVTLVCLLLITFSFVGYTRAVRKYYENMKILEEQLVISVISQD